jgi:hypothetical protein
MKLTGPVGNCARGAGGLIMLLVVIAGPWHEAAFASDVVIYGTFRVATQTALTKT